MVKNFLSYVLDDCIPHTRGQLLRCIAGVTYIAVTIPGVTYIAVTIPGVTYIAVTIPGVQTIHSCYYTRCSDDT